jgi:pyruvate/2-oxoglutarate/acetoin dehydrogenase E1 component
MKKYSVYHQAISKEMEKLSKISNVIFLGQQIAMSNNFYDTLTDIPMHKRREMPVAEEMQIGISIGMALEGYLPISIYQRMDFLPRAMDQIVNHLNLINRLSRGLYNPKIIIRTSIGTKTPLDVGLQHSQNLFELMKVAVAFPVLLLETVEDVHRGYELARNINSSICLIEKQEYYKD